MTRIFNRDIYSADARNVIQTERWTVATYPGDNTHITVSNGTDFKTVKVVDDFDVIYKLQKTQIRAKNGANGLFEYIDETLSGTSAHCLAWKVLNWIMDEMKVAA
jgi:hypothetical protein